jgi:hypothetical protein
VQELAQIAPILELLEADVLLAVSIIRAARGLSVALVPAPTHQAAETTPPCGGTVPTMVPATREDRLFGANSIQIVGLAMF